MTAPYQDILGNETEFFLLNTSQRAWSSLKKIGATIKDYFGLVGLTVILLATFVFWVPLVIIMIYYFKKLAREVPSAAQLAIKDNFQNIDWKTLKTLEHRLEMLTIFVKGMQDGMKKSPVVNDKTRAEVVTVLDALAAMSKHIRESYHFISDKPEIYTAWNQLDDIWNYETPEQDKKMMFEHNKSKRSNDAA